MQAIPISFLPRSLKIKGRIIFHKKGKNQDFYKNKIVIIPDLNLSEDVFYLKKAKAIIAQAGGLTSHGANLAREYKIPCFNLPRAARILKENKEIEISPSGKILPSLKVKKKLEPVLAKPKISPKKYNWYLTRTYIRSPLESFLEKEGIERTPQILFDQKRKARCYFDESGLRWVKGFPTPDAVAKKIIQEPKWFSKKVRERKKLYQKIKKDTSELVGKIRKNQLSLSDCLRELEKIHRIYIERRPYTALTQHPLDFIEKDFYKLSDFIPLPLKIKLFDRLLRTEYAKALSRLKMPPPIRRKKIIFHSENLIYPKTKINYQERFKLEREIKKLLFKKPKPFQEKFKRYSETIFLLTKLSDETAYLRQILRVCLIKILEKIGNFLIKKGKVDKVENLLDWKIQDLAAMARKELEKTKKVKIIKELFKRDPRIERVYNFAKKRHESAAGVIIHHSFDHVVRVLYRALILGNSEKNVNFSILIPSVLLHDIGVTMKKNSRHHTERSIIFALKVLPKFGYNLQEIKEICHAIATHGGFSVKKRKEPKTKEAKILWDADYLERSSLAAVFYLYGIFFEKKISLEEFIEKRIRGLKRRMRRGFYTKLAKKVGNRKSRQLISHFNQILKILKQRKDFLITEKRLKKASLVSF